MKKMDVVFSRNLVRQSRKRLLAAVSVIIVVSVLLLFFIVTMQNMMFALAVVVPVIVITYASFTFFVLRLLASARSAGQAFRLKKRAYELHHSALKA